MTRPVIFIMAGMLPLAWSTPCPTISNTTFQLADMLVQWAAGQNIQHGIQFEDVNGDGLVDMIYGWENAGYAPLCVYINTGYAWVQQNTSAAFDCATSATLLVRDTKISFKKHSVKQFREAVAAEFGLAVELIEVRDRDGFKHGSATSISDFFPSGFELSIVANGTSREAYICP